MKTQKIMPIKPQMTMEHMNSYQYTECGLPDVFIHNGSQPCDDKGNPVYVVENVTGLHKVISFCIIMKSMGMSGAELRFLRTEMGYTQAELAQRIHKELLTIGRWERGEVPIDNNAEAIIRVMAFENLNLEGDFPAIEDMVKKCVRSTKSEPIAIDGSDPENYKPLKVA